MEDMEDKGHFVQLLREVGQLQGDMSRVLTALDKHSDRLQVFSEKLVALEERTKHLGQGTENTRQTALNWSTTLFTALITIGVAIVVALLSRGAK